MNDPTTNYMLEILAVDVAEHRRRFGNQDFAIGWWVVKWSSTPFGQAAWDAVDIAKKAGLV